MSYFHKEVTKTKETLGLSTKELARVSGIKVNTLYKWLSGEGVGLADSIRKFGKNTNWSPAKIDSVIRSIYPKPKKPKPKPRVVEDSTPYVNRLFRIADRLQLNQKAIARNLGVAPSAISNWKAEPHKASPHSIMKIRKFNYDHRHVEHTVAKNEVRAKLNYKLIHTIERKHGSVGNCPSDDPLLKQLHDELGVDLEGGRYSKEKMDEMRIERGISMINLSKAVGRGKSWFYNSINPSREDTAAIANYFGVDMEVFENEREDG